jgi:glycosyltransferase involved in cell wall biosynthesis
MIAEHATAAAASPELSLVMPVYNEATVLAEVLTEALDTLARCGRSHEFVLVDDASTDGSAAILADFQARHPGTVRVLRNESNKGIIATCERLYAAARGRWVFVNSSDGQWQCAEVLPMLALADRYDLVVGQRRRKRYGWRRQLISGLFNLLPRLVFGVDTYDAGSIKLFRREILEIPLLSHSPFREAERIIRAQRQGYRIGAVQVEHHDRRGGQASGARWRLVAQSLIDLGRCRWQLSAPKLGRRAPAFPG